MNIELVGEVLSTVGYGNQNRVIAKALMDAGIKVKLTPAESYIQEHNKITDPFWIMKIAESASMTTAPAARVNSCIPPVAQFSQTAKNILYFMWETDKLPRAWLPIIKQAQQVWTGSDYTTKLVQQFNPNAYTVRPVVNTPDYSELQLEGLNSADVLFTHVGVWIPRKNMEDLITAFTVAFDGIKDVTLLIKTWGADNSASFKQTVLDRVRQHCHSHIGIDRPKILVVNELLPEQQVYNILGNSDVYISASRGEGFDLPLATAMSMGKLIVANKFAAHSDYLTKDNCLLYDYSLQPIVGAMIPNYDSYQNWARPSIDSMIEQMREAYKLVKEKKQGALGARAKSDISKLCSSEVVVENIKNLIGKL